MLGRGFFRIAPPLGGIPLDSVATTPLICGNTPVRQFEAAWEAAQKRTSTFADDARKLVRTGSPSDASRHGAHRARPQRCRVPPRPLSTAPKGGTNAAAPGEPFPCDRLRSLARSISFDRARWRRISLGDRMNRRWSISALFSLALLIPAVASANLKGDVNGDNRVDVADSVLLSRYLSGEDIGISPEDLVEVADIAPVLGGVSTPDGVVDVGELVVLMRGLAGEYFPAPPVLTPATCDPAANPISISGTGAENTEITIVAAGFPQATVPLGPEEVDFTFPEVAVTDGPNSIYAVATDPATGFSSRPSNTLHWDCYENEVGRTSLPHEINSTTVVLTPGTPDLPCEDCVGPYIIITDGLKITGTGKLILMPGTELRFAADDTLTVKSVLFAYGTESNLVTFTSQSGTWNGIDFQAQNTCQAKSLDLQGVLISKAATGVKISAPISVPAGCSASVSKSHIYVGDGNTGINVNIPFEPTNPIRTAYVYDNTIEAPTPDEGTGIYVIGGKGTVFVDRNVVSGLEIGIHIKRSGAEFTRNEIDYNSDGIYIEGTNNSFKIKDRNIIQDNSEHGIYATPILESPPSSAWAWGYFNPLITGNTIQNNGASVGGNITIRNIEDEHGATNVVDATGNYWGTVDVSVIEHSIADAADFTDPSSF